MYFRKEVSAPDSSHSSAGGNVSVLSCSTLTNVTQLDVDDSNTRSVRASLANGVTPLNNDVTESRDNVDEDDKPLASISKAYSSDMRAGVWVTKAGSENFGERVGAVTRDVTRAKPIASDTAQLSKQTLASDHVSFAKSSLDFVTSSPASAARGASLSSDFRPPLTASSEDDDDTEADARAVTPKADEMMSAGLPQPRAKLESANSSSSTSLEVSEILEGQQKSADVTSGATFFQEDDEDDDDEEEEEEDNEDDDDVKIDEDDDVEVETQTQEDDITAPRAEMEDDDDVAKDDDVGDADMDSASPEEEIVEEIEAEEEEDGDEETDAPATSKQYENGL